MDTLRSDQKKQFFRTKHEMEPYRHAVLLINSVLKWDQKYYPGVIFGVISTLHLMLWYLNLSVLTLIALILLVITIIDYAYPRVSKLILDSESWTGAQEKAFEAVITEVVDVQTKLIGHWNYLQKKQNEKNVFYLFVIGSFLIILAWIGASVDNLLLSYTCTLWLTLYPGLSHHGLIKILTNVIQGCISVHLNKFKSNKDDDKKE